MNILINTIPLLGEQSGVGRYTREIAMAVAHSRDTFDPTFFGSSGFSVGNPCQELAG